MTRRLTSGLCLLSMLLGSLAQAKTMLVYPVCITNTDGINGAYRQQTRNLRMVSSIVRLTGGRIDLIRSDRNMTEPFRAGRLPMTRASVLGSDTIQYDATIYLGTKPMIASAGQVRPDSLTLLSLQGSSARPRAAVPMLFMRDNTGPLANGEWNVATTCSLGVAGPQNQSQGLAFNFAGDHNASLTHAYVESITGIYETGDLRRILYGHTPAIEYRSALTDKSPGRAVPCKQCDSLQSYAANDTLLMWDRQYNAAPYVIANRGGGTANNASTITFVNPYGAGSALDSLANLSGLEADKPETEGDLTLMLAALAHLDSLSGHKVFGDRVIRIAPVVYGGLSRQQRGSSWKTPGSPQGIDPTDTAAFYATLDSIASYPGMNITFAINVDSASTYARDLIKMKSVGQARFTPQVWTGCYIPSSGTDTTSGAVVNQFMRPADVFGRFRKRAAVGDSVRHTVLGKDSSICALAARTLMLCDSLVGGDRTSHVAVAPDDDWSPLNVTGLDPGGVGIDSVLYALKLAGYSGVVANGQDPDCRASKVSAGPSQTNPRGYYQNQRLYSSGKIPELVNFKILAHSGYGLQGDIRQAAQNNGLGSIDSSGVGGGGVGMMYQDLARLWSSVLLDFDNSYDTWPFDDGTGAGVRAWDDIAYRKVDRVQAGNKRPVVHGNVFRLSCSDLSGDPTYTSRRLWHTLKSAYNAVQMINKLAGRTVVTFAYPDDIDP